MIKNYFYISRTIEDKSFQKDIIEFIDRSDDVQKRETSVKCKMTSWNVEMEPGFDKLKSYILETADYFATEKYKVNAVHKLINMWGMRYEKNDYALPHDHWPSTWSCVYYIKPPENSPPLIFPEIQEWVTPEDGTLVLFPGWVLHEVPKKDFDGKRYAVSANLTAN